MGSRRTIDRLAAWASRMVEARPQVWPRKSPGFFNSFKIQRNTGSCTSTLKRFLVFEIGLCSGGLPVRP